MVCIVRIQTQAEPEKLWNDIVSRQKTLQDALGNKGNLLYLSKRCKYNEASLFVQTAGTSVLTDLVVNHLAKLEGVTGLWIVNLLEPIFFPLPEGAKAMKRFSVTVKAYSPRLAEIYHTISQLSFPDRIVITYMAYTCHMYGDCLQFSLLADSEADVKKFISQSIDKLPGVLGTTICELEKNHSFISYDIWQKYASASPVDWDDKEMIAQFNKSLKDAHLI